MRSLKTLRFPLVGRKHYRAFLPAFIFAMTACASLTGCIGVSSIPKDPMGAEYKDRCFIEDSQFAFADQLYDKVGALQLVEQELHDRYQWKACEINEAVYRLRKVHDLP